MKEKPSQEDIKKFTLENLITKNREYVSLNLSSDEEIMENSKDLSSYINTPKQDILQEWKFITYKTFNEKTLILIGQSEKNEIIRIMSGIENIDIANRIILNNENELYQLGKPSYQKPSFEEVLHLASAFYSWGIGHTLGMPKIFY